MPPQTIETRTEALEKQMMELRELPAQVAEVGLQIVQLRTEIRGEFSAIRQEIRTGDDGVFAQLRDEIRAGDENVVRLLREEIRAGDENVIRLLRDEIRAGDEDVVRLLREEIRAGDEETRTLMRVLHEEVIGRIALLQENPAARAPRRRVAARKKKTQ